MTLPTSVQINRVWRIGQHRPVSIKRFVSAGTIEERMLALRKRSKGLLAEGGDTDDADTMAVCEVNGDEAGNMGNGKGKASAEAAAAAELQTERDEDLRYLYGCP